jgi:hypothetical protein
MFLRGRVRLKFFTHRPCTVPCKNCAGMAAALDFDIDLDTHNMLIVARIVPCLSLSEAKTKKNRLEEITKNRRRFLLHKKNIMREMKN